MNHPQTDVVVPVRDALEYTQNCFETLFAHTKDFRLIVVDDDSKVETTAYLMGLLLRQPTALYIRTGQQKWFTRASNLGLRMVRTPRAILLNSDCVVDEGWLEELYGVWEEASATPGVGRVGLVGSTLSAEEPRRWARIQHPGYVTGHCWLVSMEALSDISSRRGQPGWYLNEVLREAIHISSDRIGCWELNQAGWITIASMKAAVGHHGGKSWGYNLGRIASLRIGNPEVGEVI